MGAKGFHPLLKLVSGNTIGEVDLLPMDYLEGYIFSLCTPFFNVEGAKVYRNGRIGIFQPFKINVIKGDY
jgi:hypothetical protein